MPVITYTMACPMVMIIPNTAERQNKKMFGNLAATVTADVTEIVTVNCAFHLQFHEKT